MMLDRFSSKSQQLLERAIRLATRQAHRHVTPWHLVVAALDERGLAGTLRHSKVDVDALRSRAEAQLVGVPRAERDSSQQTPMDRRLQKVLVDAEGFATANQSEAIEPNHVFLALMGQEDVGDAVDSAGGSIDAVSHALSQSAQAKADDAVPNQFEFLAKYTRDMTAQAERGEIDPIIGRDAEIKLAIEILCRRRKNNPIVIGEPGVGKTAVAEALAQRIASKQVPADLERMRLLSLDLGQLIAGAKFRGEFEERMKSLLEEVAVAGNIILFIDEIHMIIGAGGQEGSVDAANLLKPALSRGELRCLGATTLEEYRKRIERDTALVRRFQIVQVDEPTHEETVSMLRGVKEKYELHHGVRLLDDCIHASVKFSARYLTERFLPDKAFDLLDQTAASVRLAAAAKPEAIEKLDQHIVTLRIESKALQNDTGDKAKARIAEIQAELAGLEAESAELTQRWEREKNAIVEVQKARQALDEALRRKEAAVRDEDFAAVAELEYRVIPEAQKALAQYDDVQVAEDALLDVAVTEEDIANTVSRMTGIPVSRMVGSERDRLLKLEDHLRKRVVGQDKAIQVVAKAVRRARAGVQNPNRPLGSFLMLGPTGTGKTELAKTLAEFLFDDEAALVRIDMSEYMEKHSAALLTGAPPGYVGYEEGGVLTNKVRRRPYCVLLFDEVEKGHPDVFNLFLQLLDDGRLTDTQGNTVNFANTIVMLTSNLGADRIRPVETEEDHKGMVSEVMESVRQYFRPEFINRLDDVLVFHQLTLPVMKPIVDIQLKRLAKLLADKNIGLEVKDAGRTLLAEAGFNPLYGARPLQRVIQQRLQDPLAEMIIAGDVPEGSTVLVDAYAGELSITALELGDLEGLDALGDLADAPNDAADEAVDGAESQ